MTRGGDRGLFDCLAGRGRAEDGRGGEKKRGRESGLKLQVGRMRMSMRSRVGEG